MKKKQLFLTFKSQNFENSNADFSKFTKKRKRLVGCTVITMVKGEEVAVTWPRGGVAPHSTEWGLIRVPNVEIQHRSRSCRDRRKNSKFYCKLLFWHTSTGAQFSPHFEVVRLVGTTGRSWTSQVWYVLSYVFVLIYFWPVDPSQLLSAVSPPLSTLKTTLYTLPGVRPALGMLKFTASRSRDVLTTCWEPSNRNSV